MYDTRFRKWEISKILKRDQKRKIAQGIANQYQAGESNITTKVSNRDLMKTMRWISSQSGSNYGIARVTEARRRTTSPRTPTRSSSSEQSPTSTVSPSRSQVPDNGRSASIDGLDSLLVSLTTKSTSIETSSINGSPGDTSAAISIERHESSPSQTTDLVDYARTPSPSNPLMTPETRVQDLIFQNVQLYAFNQLTNVDVTSTPANVLTHGSSPNTEPLWSNIKNGIYLLKIAAKFPESRFRVPTAFEEARLLLPSVCYSGVSLEFLRNILATLSPTNTTIDPSIRYSVLSAVANEAATSPFLGPLHPITVICDALQNDGGISLISSLALHVMFDAVRDTLGPSHPAYYKLMKTIIAMTRRDRDLGTAKQMAEGAMNVARCTCGEYSEQARSAEVELAHILTRLGEHGRAISIRMKAISLPPAHSKGIAASQDELPLSLYHNDALSMHTMEDIAEYYARFGYADEAVTWLMRARTIAENACGNTTAAGHITDKLEKLLRGDVRGQVLD